MKIGYARVSTSEQNLDLQIDELKKAGCEQIFSDKLSAMTKRKGLEDALSHLRKGDTLIVWKLDRLGRSIKSLITMVDELKVKGVGFTSITDNIDTSSPMGKLFFHIMAAVAEMERDLIIERTKAGLAAARKQNRLGGRPRKMNKSKIESAKKLLNSNVPAREVAKNLGVSIATLYRMCPASEREIVVE